MLLFYLVWIIYCVVCFEFFSSAYSFNTSVIVNYGFFGGVFIQFSSHLNLCLPGDSEK